MNEVIRHWRRSISEPVALLIMALATALCVISGPFGSLQTFSAPVRLAFWLPIIISGTAASLFIRIVLRVYFPAVAKRWIETSTVLIFLATFGGPLLAWSHYFPIWTGSESNLVSNTFQIVHLGIVAGSFLWLRNVVISVISNRANSVTEAANQNAVPSPDAPRLARRLPTGAGSDILFLAAKDHYVSVHTSDGVHQLRMRLKDAIDEMEGVTGYCTHRSYWVSHTAIANAQKSGTTWRLRLTNNEIIPVSRKYQPALEDAGLLRVEAAE